MPHAITIGGEPTEIGWTQEAAKRYAFRSSKLDVDPLAIINKPRSRERGLISMLWLLLPPAFHSRFETPEELHVAINHGDENEVAGITAALVAVIGEMFPDAEKKSTSKNSPSPESNLD